MEFLEENNCAHLLSLINIEMNPLRRRSPPLPAGRADSSLSLKPTLCLWLALPIQGALFRASPEASPSALAYRGRGGWAAGPHGEVSGICLLPYSFSSSAEHPGKSPLHGSHWLCWVQCGFLFPKLSSHRNLDVHKVQGLSFESHVLLFWPQVLSLDVSLTSGSWPHPEPQFLHLGICTKVLKSPRSLSFISHCPLVSPEHQSSGWFFAKRNTQPSSLISTLLLSVWKPFAISCFYIIPGT